MKGYIGVTRDSDRPRPVCPYCHKPQDSKYALKRHKEACLRKVLTTYGRSV